MSDTPFELKGSVVSTVILNLHTFTAEVFSRLLAEKVAAAPQFFMNSPIVLSLENAQTDVVQHLPAIIELCREVNLKPMAFRGVPEGFIEAVNATGLPILPLTGRGDSELKLTTKPAPVATKQEEPVVQTVVEEKIVSRPTKVIDKPVRSGQRILAEGDLVVLSSVNQGAEVIAEGDIHIYGALRGRAIAGAYGKESARIFCRQNHAELVSIAGLFMMSEQFDSALNGKAVHFSLNDNDGIDVVEL